MFKIVQLFRALSIYIRYHTLLCDCIFYHLKTNKHNLSLHVNVKKRPHCKITLKSPLLELWFEHDYCINIDIILIKSKLLSPYNSKRTIYTLLGLWAIVNNAGVIGTLSGPSYWASRADYDNVLQVNLYGVAMVTNAFLPLVFKAKGRVINTSSVLGRFSFGNAAYSVSKHGVEALSDTLRFATIFKFYVV